jgi:hypothetical protein
LHLLKVITKTLRRVTSLTVIYHDMSPTVLYIMAVLLMEETGVPKKETKCIDTCISLNGELRLSQ